MTTQYPKLFSPIKIGAVEIPNRIAMMPMGVFSPRLMNQKTGAYTKDGADYYIERAKGGTGLIITGLVPVTPIPFITPYRFPDEYVEQMKYLMDGIHAHGAKVFVQLTAMNGRAAHISNEIEREFFPAPAPIQNVWDPRVQNRGITIEEIHQYIQNFATTAHLVQEAGGDGVEIHAVHEGYLLDQFAIAYFNNRTDEYGGSLDNRLRFAKEIVEAIKAKCGKNFPVSIRYSVRSYIKGFNRGALPGEEFEEKGRDLEESLVVAKKLEEYGYDLLNCDNGSYDSWYWAHPPMYMPKACNLEDVSKLKSVVSIPVVCAGRFDDPELAEQAIANGQIDMLGMGRPLLADPDIVNKFYSGDLKNIRPCISCHQGCLGRIFKEKDISCAVNPACGNEIAYALTPATQKKKILVIGGGLGGMEAARVCAIRGHKVDLYEKTDQLGGVFVAAATPDFKEDDRMLLEWYKKQMKDLSVTIHMNTIATKETAKEYDEIFVATGADERRLNIEGFDSPAVTYACETLYNKNDKNIEGQNVVVLGGGLTGCEIAYMYAKEGKTVTIVEVADTILNVDGLSASNYNMLMELMDYYKIKVLKNTVIDKFENHTAYVTQTIKNTPNIANRAMFLSGIGPAGILKTYEIPTDHIVVSVGYISNQTLYEEIKSDHTYLIGDAKKPANIMEAIWASYDIARSL